MLVPRINEIKLALLSVLRRRLPSPPSNPNSVASLFSFASAQIAAQLTRVDHAAFAAVPLDDFLEKRWESQSANCQLRQLIERSNNMSDWVASCVLVQPTNVAQARAAERFLEIAHHCMQFGNYLAVSGIMAGFAQWSMSRLTRLWQIRQPYKVLHQHMSTTMSSDKNYAMYVSLSMSTGCCLPFPFGSQKLNGAVTATHSRIICKRANPASLTSP
jgi:hypothetical protein